VEVWRAAAYGPLEARQTLRIVIPAVTLTLLGAQTILSSFFLSLLQLGRRSKS